MGKPRMELVRADATTPAGMHPEAHPDAAALACAPTVDLALVDREPTEEDQRRFFSLIDTRLTPEQEARILTPPATYPRQQEILAVHWHPEYVPFPLIKQRLDTLYPNARETLIIPTQHNVMLTWGEYAGVEVDCYSSGFNRKVQLLLHFRAENVGERAHTLNAMLAHTLKYRGSQLFELLDALLLDSQEEIRQRAAGESGADEALVEFCGIQAAKLKQLVETHWNDVPVDMIKNKLVRNWLDMLREYYGDRFIARCQTYVKQVKLQVKERFSLSYFYRASEVIEEARSLGAGVVIPHPEQFWPILLAGYDVDGYEVWNPQSLEYTEFLITVVHRQNRSRCRTERQLLVFMGDDCHMSEKLKDPASQDPEKTAREVGLQPPWEDMRIRKSLIVAGMDRRALIAEYAERLA